MTTLARCRCVVCNRPMSGFDRVCSACRNDDASTYRRRGSGRTHGIRATYINGCRCGACTAAERDYQRQRRARREATT